LFVTVDLMAENQHFLDAGFSLFSESVYGDCKRVESIVDSFKLLVNPSELALHIFE